MSRSAVVAVLIVGVCAVPTALDRASIEGLYAAGINVLDVSLAARVPGGLSNRNFHIAGNVDGHFGEFLLRIPGDAASPFYGDVHLVDRVLERRCATAAHAAGTSPELVRYVLGSGVSLTRWIDGKVLSSENFTAFSFQKSRLAAVVTTLRQFHDRTLFEPPTPLFSPMLRAQNYVKVAPSLGVTIPESLTEGLQLAAQADKALAARFRRAMASGREIPVALHCDLNPANFIDSDGQVSLLDFEYCHMGERDWDLTNLMLFNRFPSDVRQEVLQAYDSAGHELIDRPTMREAKHAVMEWMWGFSEGLWGLAHNAVTDIPFDASWTAPGIDSFEAYGLAILNSTVRKLEDPVFRAQLDLILKWPDDSSEL